MQDVNSAIQVQILIVDICISHLANAFQKGMDLTVLFSVIGQPDSALWSRYSNQFWGNKISEFKSVLDLRSYLLLQGMHVRDTLHE